MCLKNGCLKRQIDLELVTSRRSLSVVETSRDVWLPIETRFRHISTSLNVQLNLTSY